MTNKFRNLSPERTFTKTYKNYRRYKPYLKKDFKHRCGYTNCSDFWFGGVKTFHIDHFKPKSKHPNLETEYSNLIYCCSYVNILKSDDEGEYIDPCDVNYNDHFERDNEGNIIPKKDSPQANYMFLKLKLYLKRYQIIWILDELSERIDKLGKIIEKEADEDYRKYLLETYFEINQEFHKYKKFLSQEQ